MADCAPPTRRALRNRTTDLVQRSRALAHQLTEHGAVEASPDSRIRARVYWQLAQELSRCLDGLACDLLLAGLPRSSAMRNLAEEVQVAIIITDGLVEAYRAAYGVALAPPREA